MPGGCQKLPDGVRGGGRRMLGGLWRPVAAYCAGVLALKETDSRILRSAAWVDCSLQDGSLEGLGFCSLEAGYCKVLEDWKGDLARSTLWGGRRMTGSAFEAMDVVVACDLQKREEVWRRGGSKLSRAGG